MISCVLLSAGQSARFGSPKALARIGSETVIERLQREVISTKAINELIIVLGSEAQRIEPFILKHKKVRVVYNKDHKFGQTSSFKAGLRSVSARSTGVMLLPVDYPLVNSRTLSLLAQKFDPEKHLIVVPLCDGQKGHPPIFHVNLISEILSLDDSQGLNSLASHHGNEMLVLPVQDSGVISSFNTKEELERIVAAR